MPDVMQQRRDHGERSPHMMGRRVRGMKPSHPRPCNIAPSRLRHLCLPIYLRASPCRPNHTGSTCRSARHLARKTAASIYLSCAYELLRAHGRCLRLRARPVAKFGIEQLRAPRIRRKFAYLCLSAISLCRGLPLSRIATRFRAEQYAGSLSVILKTLSFARFTCVLARCIFVFYAFSRAILRLHLKYPLFFI